MRRVVVGVGSAGVCWDGLWLGSQCFPPPNSQGLSPGPCTGGRALPAQEAQKPPLLRAPHPHQIKDTVTMDAGRANKEAEILRKQCKALCQELKEALQEADVAKCRRDWAFQERDKIVAERDSIRYGVLWLRSFHEALSLWGGSESLLHVQVRWE